MNRQRQGHSAVSGLFVFLLLGAFAVFSTLLVLLGAQAYRGTVARSGKHSEGRILLSFVRSAVAADDEAGVISVGTEDGLDVLKFTYDLDGDKYVKRLYCADGALRELFTDEERPFAPEEGESICPAEAFSAEIEDGLLTANLVSTDGQEYAVHIALHAGEQP